MTAPGSWLSEYLPGGPGTPAAAADATAVNPFPESAPPMGWADYVHALRQAGAGLVQKVGSLPVAFTPYGGVRLPQSAVQTAADFVGGGAPKAGTGDQSMRDVGGLALDAYFASQIPHLLAAGAKAAPAAWDAVAERLGLRGPDISGLLGKAANPDVVAAVRPMVRNPQMPRVTSVNAPLAQRMAQIYEGLPTNDPAARGAYDALNSEVQKQYDALQKAGYRFEFTDTDPYKNSSEMMQDVRDNKRLKVFKTPADNFHPYMTPEQNDRFRAVHDLIAHAGPGNQFGPIGEENAYRMHAATLSPEAQQALATETRGQNSWVNFGPNAALPPAQRPFAAQKAALWPPAFLGDYTDMPSDMGIRMQDVPLAGRQPEAVMARLRPYQYQGGPDSFFSAGPLSNERGALGSADQERLLNNIAEKLLDGAGRRTSFGQDLSGRGKGLFYRFEDANREGPFYGGANTEDLHSLNQMPTPPGDVEANQDLRYGFPSLDAVSRNVPPETMRRLAQGGFPLRRVAGFPAWGDGDQIAFTPLAGPRPAPGVSGASVLGGMTLGGGAGAYAGSQVGSTPQERARNALLGLGAGMVAGGVGGPAAEALGERGAAGAQPELFPPQVLTRPEGGNTIPLDVSINPDGVDLSRPDLYRPARADLSALDPVKRRIRSVYTPAAVRGLQENPTGAAWYDLSPLRRIFENESPTGAQDFDMFTKFMGPTSAGTDVPMNIRQASMWYKLWKNGELTPEALANKSLDIPQGYNNRLNIRPGLTRILTEGSLDPLSTPKTFRYSSQLGGRSWGGVALDRHVGYNIGVPGDIVGSDVNGGNALGRAFPTGTPGKVSTSPMDTHYAAIEDAMVREADKLGVPPAVYQAAGWVGNAAKTGVEDARHPLEIINAKLPETAKRFGHASNLDALLAFIRGQSPLWALGGISAGAGLAGGRSEGQ